MIVELFEDLAKLAVEEENLLGVVVIVDELGKLLEHAALEPAESDIHILQEMAEFASRSNDHPLWFITILHQEFSQYATRLGRRHQREWTRVQQRFFDVPCLMNDSDSLQLVAAALSSSTNFKVVGNASVRSTAAACSKLAPRGSENDFEETCIASYPLHPVTLVMLPATFRRLGQNERSLFSFLSADEPFSLQDWSRKQVFNARIPPFFRPSDLYDYVSHTLLAGSPNPQMVRQWTEIEDAMSRLGDVAPEELNVVKTIGLMGLIGESSHVSPSRESLELIQEASATRRQKLDRIIKDLESKRLIVFRRFRNAYRLWEGSDVDIGERISDAYQALPPHSVALTVAAELCPAPPLMARKHSFRTGMLRFFSVQPASAATLPVAMSAKTEADGRVIQCLVESEEECELAQTAARGVNNPSVIVLVGKSSDELVETARDVVALEWIKRNTPELEGDRVARQELSERRVEAETAFRAEWSKVFSPGSKHVEVFWHGLELSNLSSKAFASLLSEACDVTFPYAPVVKNELINRRELSSSAAAARRNLVEAMLSSTDQPGLGIIGYPPQRSIYESLLLTSGMHTDIGNGRWAFVRPNDTDLGLQRVWDHIIQSATPKDFKPKPVVDLFDEITRSPFGVADGFAPVLLCACLIANKNTMALYEDGAFIPELTVPAMERLMRKPASFSINQFELAGERSTVIKRFARGFRVEEGVLPVVRALYARMRFLPKYTLITSDLPRQAIEVREVILRAKSPEKLLFVDLPTALGCQPFQANASDNDTNARKNTEVFFDALNGAMASLANCYPSLLHRVKQGILDIFEVSDEQNWTTKLVARATKISDAATDSKLRTLIVRAKDGHLAETEYLESLAAGVVGQPPSQWGKSDEEAFTRLIPHLRSLIHAAESVLHVSDVLDEGEEGLQLSISNNRGEVTSRLVRYSSAERDEIQRAVKILEQAGTTVNRRLLLAAFMESAKNLIAESESRQENS
ncbi:MAG: hypothetical protein HYX79_00700 [Chloroflexi bacterium]|nr:hypothetical protein [Chloroflexota bacterium]